MASLDDVVSNLKNIVLNLSGLSTGTTLVNSLTTLTVSVNSIASTLSTAFATTHYFGGTFTLTAGLTTVVVEPRVAGNASVVFSPRNFSAASTIIGDFVWVQSVTASVGFIVLTDGTALGSEVFSYVCYNP